MESYALPHQSLFPLVCKQDQLIWKDCVFHTRSPQSDFCINICIHKGNIKIVKAGVYHKRLLNLSQSVPSTHEQGLPKINLAFPQIILYKDKSQLGMVRWNTNLVILFFSCESGFFFRDRGEWGGSGGEGIRHLQIHTRLLRSDNSSQFFLLPRKHSLQGVHLGTRNPSALNSLVWKKTMSSFCYCKKKIIIKLKIKRSSRQRKHIQR